MKKNKLRYLAFFLFSAFLTFQADLAYAQTDTDLGVGVVDETIALGDKPLVEVIGNIINIFLGLLGIIALVMIVYGGYKIMTSGGNEEKVEEGKRTLINATIGLIIIMASFAIVNFVVNALVDATTQGDGGAGSRGGAPAFQTFSGSGALGDVIQDHYPGRDVTGIKRNTKISVTFNFPVAPETVLKNTNDTCWTKNGGSTTTPNQACIRDQGNIIPYYGDCLKNGGKDGNFQWGQDCDQIRTSSVRISKTTSTDIMEGAGMISYEGGVNRKDAQAKTFVFKTNDFLGSNQEKKWHTVELTDEIKRKKKDSQGNHKELFKGVDNNYEWKFQTDTNFDFDPPEVVNVYPPKRKPNNRATIHKNSIIQITFSEPMDPTTVQGLVSSSPSGISPFENIIFDTSTMKGDFEGRWKITNGYRTVEFIPSNKCGTNSCGDPMYCLNLNCVKGNKSCTQKLTTLIRTAKLTNPNASWQAQPFTGVVDMSGNALDGNRDGNRDQKPVAAKGNIDPWSGYSNNEKSADNFFWSYGVMNKIDRRIPYIQRTQPVVDEDNIPGNTSLEIAFSMPMMYSSLTGIDLDEYSTSTAKKGGRPVIPGSGRQKLPAISFSIDAKTTSTGVSIPWNKSPNTTGTIATVNHREFGPNGMNLFYTTSVSTSVKGINQNCMYPGFGPKQGNQKCKVQRGKNGAIKQNPGCVGVKINAKKDAGCPYNWAGVKGNQEVTSTLSKCKRKLRNQTAGF
ncbi:MAG: Mbov_0395 family pilin-like conjugal transfer protein [Candidatus Magasanikbacteria bacterium]